MAESEFKFTDHSIEVTNALKSIAYKAVEESTGELESQVKRNTVVDTGQTKGGWTHTVKSDGDITVGVVGNPLQNAIWEEFGTGEYALNGDGRKGGWFYVDEEGKGHFTYGKHPRRPFFRAYTALKSTIIRHIQNAIKGGLK